MGIEERQTESYTEMSGGERRGEERWGGDLEGEIRGDIGRWVGI